MPPGAASNLPPCFHPPLAGAPFLLQRNCLYVADTEAHALREVDLGEKTVKTLAGGPLHEHSA
jgi:hypothetical protein